MEGKSLKLTRLSHAGLALLTMNVIGGVYSVLHHMPYRSGGEGDPRYVLHDYLVGHGTALEPPVTVMVFFFLMLCLNLRSDRWGLTGTFIAMMAGVLNVFGLLTEPNTMWVFREATRSVPQQAIVVVQLAAAVAVVVLSIQDLRTREWRPPQTS